jgi:hypothetical protein
VVIPTRQASQYMTCRLAGPAGVTCPPRPRLHSRLSAWEVWSQHGQPGIF